MLKPRCRLRKQAARADRLELGHVRLQKMRSIER
jgi:hypothetical protein